MTVFNFGSRTNDFFASIENEVEKLFSEVVNPYPEAPTKIETTADKLVITVALPGVKPEDVDAELVAFDTRTLFRVTANVGDEIVSTSRNIPASVKLNLDTVTQSLELGLLTVTVDLVKPEEPKVVKVTVA